ncbi:MAG TPA: Cof-type HAD-IIB family hydrolase [Candidatus Acidoferrum sp.]|nr:Cof-type HAD-IIB family hydrolase [Candidatus Acidoferrum sp.]
MGIRLIAVDIDGTLLDSHWKVPEANQRAIARAVNSGIEVALVTGRRFDFALPISLQLGCPITMIVNNGAVVKSSRGDIQLRHLLPAEEARRVLGATMEFRDGAAVVFDRPRAEQVIFERMNWEDPHRRGYYERNKDYIAFCTPLEECLTEDPIQVMYSGTVQSSRNAAAILRRLNSSNQFALAITEYEARDFALVDVVHPAVSKGATLAEWASRQGYDREEVMAIGDNLNDREMLEYAGMPVVMGNSVAELKTTGWRETLSNDDAGVAHAIHAYALGDA